MLSVNAKMGLREGRLAFLKQANERFFGTDGDTLQPLGGFRRTRESTIDAVGNVLGGTGQLLFSKGNRLRGAARIVEGVANAVDVIPSAGADAFRSVMGTPSGHYPPSITNTGRALSHWRDIRTDDPINAIKDAMVSTVDTAHALLTRPVTDVVRLVRSSKSLAA